MNGFHVKPEHAFQALDTAHGGPVEEGNVGGTGMICNEFKGGIGSASRVLDARHGSYTIGVLVQCNYGWRSQLRIAGVPVGREIPEHTVRDNDVGSNLYHRRCGDGRAIDPDPTEASRPARLAWLGQGREFFRGWLGRHFHRVFNCQSWGCEFKRHSSTHNASQREP